jgi:hypothetical protein
MPRQKKTIGAKNTEWRKQNVDGGLKLLGLNETNRRSNAKDKLRNYKLYNGHFDKNDMDTELQSISIEGMSFPASPQYRDVTSPIFNLLFGEEARRGTEFIMRGSGDEIHSSREDTQRDLVLQMLDGEGQFKDIEEIEKYMTYSYEDMRESIASKTLKYLYQDQKMDQVFAKAWEDVLLAGEEIYRVDMISNEPVARRVNPLDVYFLLDPNSDLIDDADLIVDVQYMPVGKIIDDFYEDLSQTEIDELEELGEDRVPFGNAAFNQLPQKEFIGTEDDISHRMGEWGYLDSEGNVRVARVIWKSRKRVGFLTSIDENGDEQEELVSEEARADKSIGESIDWFWINEYWEGTLIAEDIYINMRPRKNQFRRMDNISYCRSGYVGTIYNANNSKSVSLMDRLVPWIYLHITLWYRTELLIAANLGKIALIDISLIPTSEMSMEKWMYYASTLKFAFVNSFEEGVKGQSTGKLAGNITDHNKVLDLETGQAIAGHISLLVYVEEKLDALSGVTQQRKGAISAREAVGNVEKTIDQSSLITEKWFQIHNWTKQRVLETLMEVAKDAYVDQSKKFRYVNDDMASIYFELDGNEFINSEFGVFVTDASEDQEALRSLKQHFNIALQNDKVAFSDAATLFGNKSIADITNKLKQSEAKRAEEQNQQAQATIQAQAAEGEATRAQEDKKLGLESKDKAKDREKDILVANINADNKLKTADKNRNGIPDIIEKEGKLAESKEKIALDKEKETNKKSQEEEKLRLQREKQDSDVKLKDRELDIKEKDVKKKAETKKKTGE